MKSCKVSIILLNYNSHRFTYNCVNSIVEKTIQANQGGVEYEIILVDNNSADTDYEALELIAQQPSVRLIRSRINLGFSGGNMLGVQHADPQTDYYYFLNNDCVLRTDVCCQLTAFMETTPGAAHSQSD